MGIARHHVALRFRRQASRLENAKRWWAGLDGQTGQWLAGSCDAPPDVLESKELASMVRAALLKLPADYQTLLTSRYVDGVSAEQIAREAGSTGQAVRAKLTRARGAFRKAFQKLVPNDSGVPGSRSHEQR